MKKSTKNKPVNQTEVLVAEVKRLTADNDQFQESNNILEDGVRKLRTANSELSVRAEQAKNRAESAEKESKSLQHRLDIAEAKLQAERNAFTAALQIVASSGAHSGSCTAPPFRVVMSTDELLNKLGPRSRSVDRQECGH